MERRKLDRNGFLREYNITEEEFAASLDFVQRVELAKAHVFAYSIRPGTRAASMEGQIPA